MWSFSLMGFRPIFLLHFSFLPRLQHDSHFSLSLYYRINIQDLTSGGANVTSTLSLHDSRSCVWRHPPRSCHIPLKSVIWFNKCWWRMPESVLSSVLKLEAVNSSETLLSAYKSTRRYNPEDQHPSFIWFISVFSPDCRRQQETKRDSPITCSK
jgi:hypothetical protein